MRRVSTRLVIRPPGLGNGNAPGLPLRGIPVLLNATLGRCAARVKHGLGRRVAGPDGAVVGAALAGSGEARFVVGRGLGVEEFVHLPRTVGQGLDAFDDGAESVTAAGVLDPLLSQPEPGSDLRGGLGGREVERDGYFVGGVGVLPAPG